MTSFFTICGLFLAASLPLLSADKPNIVIYLADDLGFADIGCYGNPIIQTPHLDALAKEGVKLTDCHSGGTVCSPSRASILTGRTPYRTGFYTIAGPEGSHLRKEEISLATVLKAEGYDTCFLGKWHLSHFNNRQPNPGDHGFDHWFGTALNAFDGPEDTNRWVRNGKKVGKVGQWYCEAIADEASNWIKNRPNPEKPYFIYICSHEPHTPVRPPEKYSARYDSEKIEILESTFNYGQIHRPLDRDISGNKKYYYGTVTQLDDSIGRVLKTIDEQGDRDDTLFIFTSDNGPETPVTVEESENQWEDPIRDRCFGTPGPWRGMKRYVFEGGHRVPGIVRWPGKIKPGSHSSALVNGTDWFATACAVAGASIPTDRTIDGVNALTALQGEEVKREIPACWMFPVGYDSRLLASMAMRIEDKVLVGWFQPKKGKIGNSEWVRSTNLERFELYDLSLDRSQNYPLNETHPEQLKEYQEKMIKLWKGIQTEAPDWLSVK